LFFDTNGKSIANREPVHSYVIFEEWVPHKFSSQAPYQPLWICKGLSHDLKPEAFVSWAFYGEYSLNIAEKNLGVI
jgi:hypothetical protein